MTSKKGRKVIPLKGSVMDSISTFAEKASQNKVKCAILLYTEEMDDDIEWTITPLTNSSIDSFRILLYDCLEILRQKAWGILDDE